MIPVLATRNRRADKGPAMTALELFRAIRLALMTAGISIAVVLVFAPANPAMGIEILA